MATNYFNIRGTVKWPKVYEPDEYLGVKRWTVNFYPLNAEEKQKLIDSGISTKLQKDNEGNEFMKLRRPTTKAIKDNLVVFAPPKLTGLVNVDYVDQEGNPITSYNKGDGKEIRRRGEPVDIGNDTEVILNFSVYTTVKGNGHRFEGMKIINLVKYEGISSGDEGVPEDEQDEVKEEPVKATKVSKKEGQILVTTEPSIKEDMNDEIPW